MVEEQKTSPADAPAPDELKAVVRVADAASAESRALVPASDADSISTTLAALYARSPDRIEAVLQRTTILRGLLRRTNEDFLEIGRQLIEQRRDIKPGKWQEYLRKVLGVSQPSAFQAIRAVEPFGALPGNVLANFDRHAICLLSPPTVSEARVEAVKRAKAGEHITKPVAQALIAPPPAASVAPETVKPVAPEPEQPEPEPEPPEPEQPEPGKGDDASEQTDTQPADLEPPTTRPRWITSSTRRSARASTAGMRKTPLKTSEFRKQHGADLNHLNAILENPGADSLEQVRKIAADMTSRYGRWTLAATDI
jgi:hypothetical protein